MCFPDVGFTTKDARCWNSWSAVGQVEWFGKLVDWSSAPHVLGQVTEKLHPMQQLEYDCVQLAVGSTEYSTLVERCYTSNSNVPYMPIPVGVIHGLKTCSSRSEEEETHTSPPHFPLKLFNNRPVLCTHYMITQTLKHNHLVVSTQAACIIMSHIC